MTDEEAAELRYECGMYRSLYELWERRATEYAEEIRRLTITPPVSLHWLGDRESADATRHASDATGCVMYFQNEGECHEFMLALSNR
jgi:hypothetical protein